MTDFFRSLDRALAHVLPTLAPQQVDIAHQEIPAEGQE